MASSRDDARRELISNLSVLAGVISESDVLESRVILKFQNVIYSFIEYLEFSNLHSLKSKLSMQG